jgi:signal peptidase I
MAELQTHIATQIAPRPAAHPHHHPVGTLPAVQSLLYMLIVSLFVMTFIVQPIRIPSASMEPTLLVGDFLLMDKQTTEALGLLPRVAIHRGDVIVFHDPVDDPSIHLVKRVIGIPGDTIHLRDGIVYLNGQPLKETYTIYRQSAEDRFRDDFPDLQTVQAHVNPNWWISLRSLVHDGEVTVPPGHYFVMGDNRNDSEDSRYWGFVPREAIVGKPLLIYFSWRQPGVDEAVSVEPAATPIHPVDDPASSSFARWDRTFRVVR